MSITINSKVFALDSSVQNGATYAGPSQSLSVRDSFGMSRTAPKPTSTYSGTARTESKLTRTVDLTDALTPTGLASLNITSALPIGMSDADIDTLAADLASLAATTGFKNLLKKGTFLV
jgi:hypothetical protein